MPLSLAEPRLPKDLVPKPSLPLPISIDPFCSSIYGEPIPITNQESKKKKI
jgi:hypothetical protein